MIIILLALAAALPSSPIYGLAAGGDGDSLTIGPTRVRLFGVDAPEFDQVCKRGNAQWACGQEAASRLAKLVTGREVRCLPVSEDQYGRMLARCSVGGVDVNRTMVSTGYAVAYRQYSTDYVRDEEKAKLARLGLWSGTFVVPSEVRASGRAKTSPVRPAERQVKTTSRPTGGCTIKGNHSRRGDWIYHVPGMPYYERTRPEAIFCSEAQAQAAGYRRAIVR